MKCGDTDAGACCPAGRYGAAILDGGPCRRAEVDVLGVANNDLCCAAEEEDLKGVLYEDSCSTLWNGSSTLLLLLGLLCKVLYLGFS